jgi:hypothetical protein
MQPDEDRQLWDLLGRAVAPKVSPFFARNVVRRVRSEAQSVPSRTGWSLWRVLIPATTAVLIVLGATIFLRNPSPEKARVAVSVPATQHYAPSALSDQQIEIEADSSKSLAEIDEQDYDVVQNLDDLMSTYETNLWDENSAL